MFTYLPVKTAFASFFHMHIESQELTWLFIHFLPWQYEWTFKWLLSLSKSCYGIFYFLPSPAYEVKTVHFLEYKMSRHTIKMIYLSLHNQKFLWNWNSQVIVHSHIFHHIAFPCDKLDFSSMAVCSICNKFPTPHEIGERREDTKLFELFSATHSLASN
jgi:hypothetical protein